MRAGRPTQAQGFLRLRDEFTGDSLSAAVLERWRRVLVASHLADSAVAAESAGDRTAAVQLLGRARNAYPESRVIALLMFGLQAKDAWAQRDWSALVRIDSALFALLPRQPFAAINLADAYAAMYAATGDTVARAAAERLLGAARLMAAWSPAQRPALDLAVQRVRYRLATRQILSAEEYAHRFPVTGSSRR
jgi:hypothetical protein